jgi:hypothetical protein
MFSSYSVLESTIQMLEISEAGRLLRSHGPGADDSLFFQFLSLLV